MIQRKKQRIVYVCKKTRRFDQKCRYSCWWSIDSPGRIEDFCPLFKSGLNEPLTSQLDKDDVEKIGLVKFDFLGLTTLTILDQTIKLINSNRKEKVQLGEISLTDKSTYETFSRANTIGVFQFESPGMRDLLKKSRPNLNLKTLLL